MESIHRCRKYGRQVTGPTPAEIAASGATVMIGSAVGLGDGLPLLAPMGAIGRSWEHIRDNAIRGSAVVENPFMLGSVDPDFDDDIVDLSPADLRTPQIWRLRRSAATMTMPPVMISRGLDGSGALARGEGGTRLSLLRRGNSSAFITMPPQAWASGGVGSGSVQAPSQEQFDAMLDRIERSEEKRVSKGAKRAARAARKLGRWATRQGFDICGWAEPGKGYGFAVEAQSSHDRKRLAEKAKALAISGRTFYAVQKTAAKDVLLVYFASHPKYMALSPDLAACMAELLSRPGGEAVEAGPAEPNTLPLEQGSRFFPQAAVTITPEPDGFGASDPTIEGFESAEVGLLSALSNVFRLKDPQKVRRRIDKLLHRISKLNDRLEELGEDRYTPTVEGVEAGRMRRRRGGGRRGGSALSALFGQRLKGGRRGGRKPKKRRKRRTKRKVARKTLNRRGRRRPSPKPRRSYARSAPRIIVVQARRPEADEDEYEDDDVVYEEDLTDEELEELEEEERRREEEERRREEESSGFVVLGRISDVEFPLDGSTIQYPA